MKDKKKSSTSLLTIPMISTPLETPETTRIVVQQLRVNIPSFSCQGWAKKVILA